MRRRCSAPAFLWVCLTAALAAAPVCATGRPVAMSTEPAPRVDQQSRTVPGTVWFQGFIADPVTSEPIDGPHDVVVSIYDSESGGALLWGPETHSSTPVARGWFNIELGSIDSPLPAFDSPPYFLQIEIGGELLEPRSKLASVPTALRADSVEGGSSGGIDGGGVEGYIPKFTGAQTIGNSAIRDTMGRVTIGADTSDAKLRVENAGNLPTLKLVNTASGGGYFNMFEIVREEEMGGSDGILDITAGVNPDYDGTMIDCVSRRLNMYTSVWRLEADGSVYADGPYSAVGREGYAIDASAYPNGSGWGAAVYAEMLGSGAERMAVLGEADNTADEGIGGFFSGGLKGVVGQVQGATYGNYYGVSGICLDNDGGTSYGVYGEATGTGLNYGMYAEATGTGSNYAVYGEASNGSTNWAGYFDGDVRITGTLDTSLGGFRIDNPLDPDGSYLRHAAVHSSERKTVYDGTVTLGAEGTARVGLPEWFESLNGDVRYQLTPIGAPAPNLHVASRVSGGSFSIAGGEPGMEVCWMITGVRRDDAALSNPITVQQPK